MYSFSHLIFGICLLICLSACGDSDDAIKIPKATMSNIMGDVHMAEGALLNVPYAKKDSMRIVYYEQIYAIHGVTEENFRHDVTYYQEHPEEMEDLYDEVIKNLGDMDRIFQKGPPIKK